MSVEKAAGKVESSTVAQISEVLERNVRIALLEQSALLEQLGDMCRSITDLALKSTTRSKTRRVVCDRTHQTGLGASNTAHFVDLLDKRLKSKKPSGVVPATLKGRALGEKISSARKTTLRGNSTKKDTSPTQRDAENSEHTFKAGPFPHCILRTTEYRLREQAREQVRKICIKARAEEMLKCSTMPFSDRVFVHKRPADGGSADRKARPRSSDHKDRVRQMHEGARITLSGACHSTRCKAGANQEGSGHFRRPAPPIILPSNYQLNATARLRHQYAMERRAEERKQQEQLDRTTQLRQRRETQLQKQLVKSMAPNNNAAHFKNKLAEHRTFQECMRRHPFWNSHCTTHWFVDDSSDAHFQLDRS
ncbi:uncharacterized protein LOC135397364 isoform X2 [Ornithodoros turicata]|uniref:uncharacterized protein LOC135397364 isoform X2 n=1 Tax=Ornithodoros turicata TaxID=34597 RepID=UPI0031396017